MSILTPALHPHSAAIAPSLASSIAPSVALAIGRYRARFRVTEPVHLPPYPGSAWRGAFGHALKQALCVTRAPHCDGCQLLGSCAYAYLFETPLPPQAEKMRKYPAAPHPFVLDLDLQGGELATGACYELGFTLIGRGNQQLSYMVYALEQAGKQGIGQGRGRLTLERIEQQPGPDAPWISIYQPGGPCQPLAPHVPEVPPLPDRFSVSLETPLRLKRNSAIVGRNEFTFAALFPNLLRRISMLSYFHSDTPLETDFAALVQASKVVPIDKVQLRWFDWTRYSSRQQREMKLGGLIGSFTLQGAQLDPFWPYLWLGQYIHVGAVTSMGLGRYRINADACAIKSEASAIENEASAS